MESTTNPRQVFCRKALEAVRTFRKQKPWQGSLAERKQKFEALHARLCKAYNLQHALAFARDLLESSSYFSSFEVADGKITLHSRLSVVTYFVAIGMARGYSYDQAFLWGSALYTRLFPLSASRHSNVGGFFVRNAS